MITTPNHRSSSFFLVAAVTITLIATLAVTLSQIASITNVANSQQSIVEGNSDIDIKPLSADAFPQYHQSEWTYRPLITSLKNALAAYHRSEWSSVAIAVTGVGGLDVYHQSERTLIDPKAGLAIYLLSEHVLVDPQAGIAVYLNSERTSIPIQFTPYQLSEWFGK